jgi:hypothetical protein
MKTTPYASGCTRGSISPDQYQESIRGRDSLYTAETQHIPCRVNQYRRRLRSLLATTEFAYSA